MGSEYFRAVIVNETTDTYMIVKNGDSKPGKKIGPNDFAIIAPGESSDSKFRNIDALAVYSLKDNMLIMVEGTNGKSHWWKIPDRNHGSIKVNEHGAIYLDTSYQIPNSFHVPFNDPLPSNASESRFKLEYLDTLLKEAKLPVTDISATTSKLADNISPPHTKTLLAYLTKNHTPGDCVKILKAIEVRTTEPDRAV